MKTIFKIIKEVYKIIEYIYIIVIKKIRNIIRDEDDIIIKTIIFCILGFILGFRQLLLE